MAETRLALPTFYVKYIPRVTSKCLVSSNCDERISKRFGGHIDVDILVDSDYITKRTQSRPVSLLADSSR
jgi:hypothetical protein